MPNYDVNKALVNFFDDFSQFNYPITIAHMNFMMRNHVRRRKYNVCEIKVSICVVYTLGRQIFFFKRINKIERPIYPV